MKALSIDSSGTCISIASRNEDKSVLVSLDIGMRQSEKILSSIITVLNEIEMSPKDLDFSCLCLGPGSFTGLRLSFSALKSLELAHSIPIYGIPTLSVLAHSYRVWPGAVIPCIDAKKNRFYTAVYRNGIECLSPCDIECKDILPYIDREEKILCTGHDSKLFIEQLLSCNADLQCSSLDIHSSNSAFTLMDMAYDKYSKNEKPLEEYEGPVYIRPSEAEESLLPKHS